MIRVASSRHPAGGRQPRTMQVRSPSLNAGPLFRSLAVLAALSLVSGVALAGAPRADETEAVMAELTGQGTCPGDCNGHNGVEPDELVRAVKIALGGTDPQTCPGIDTGDGAVTVDEILAAVNNALDECPTGDLTFDKVSLAVFLDGEDTVSVTATDDSGVPMGWTVASSAPNVVNVVKSGSTIKVKGVSLGRAVITVTAESRLRRTVPVRVYDPMVLDVGEILIKYVDTFECIAQGGPTTAPRDESFYRPVVPEGWYALGSFRLPQSNCPNIDGQQWMMVVTENPASWGTAYDESVSGDLAGGGPGDPPRAMALTVGNNEVKGSIDGADWIDSFSFALNPGEHLNSVILTHFAGSAAGVRFFKGTNPAADPPDFLGEASMSAAQSGANYLDLLDLDLGPGVYTISIVGSQAQYEFILNVGANPATPPLVMPRSYYTPIDDYYGWTLWAPVCPDGYVALGGVVTTAPDDSTYPQPVGTASCVRQDLTVPGVAPQDYFSTARIEAPNNTNEDATTAYVETGTMSVRFRKGEGEVQVANVLAVELPLLVDVPSQSWAPHLTSAEVPPKGSEPVLTKVLLVPFTILGGGDAYAAKGVGWMVENSPFVRVERAQAWWMVQWVYNSSTLVQHPTYTIESGIQTGDDTTISHKGGVSVTTGGGVKFLGIGGKWSATVSYEFGYSTNHNVTNFVHQSAEIPIEVAPCTAAAVWQLASTIVVEMLSDKTGQLTEIAALGTEEKPMYDDLRYVYDDYPIPGCP